MKSNFIKIIRTVAILAMIIISGALTVKAQQPVTSDIKREIVDSIISPWQPWTRVVINGKLKMAGLPMKPSVKIFMERDSSVFISVRAPFVGEVGRAEITDSTLLVVNKMKKVYVEEPIKSALSAYPGGLSDIQELILGRISLPGLGTLSHDIEESVDIYNEADGTISLVVDEEASIPGFNYGYVIDKEFWPIALLVLPESNPDVSVTLIYDYFEDGYDFSLFYKSDKRNFEATLELDEPEWEGNSFERISLNKKFRRVELQEFMKSF